MEFGFQQELVQFDYFRHLARPVREIPTPVDTRAGQMRKRKSATTTGKKKKKKPPKSNATTDHTIFTFRNDRRTTTARAYGPLGDHDDDDDCRTSDNRFAQQTHVATVSDRELSPTHYYTTSRPFSYPTRRRRTLEHTSTPRTKRCRTTGPVVTVLFIVIIILILK